MNYVNELSRHLALGMEQRFQRLPPSAGVLFVSVRAVPESDGVAKSFEVRLGINRLFEEETGLALIKRVLEPEIAEKKFSISASVYRGVLGAARDENHEGPGPLPS